VAGVRSRVGRAHEYLPVVEGLWGAEVIDQGALILEPEAAESLHLSFGDLDGGVEQGPGDNLIAGGGGEGALIAVEGVAVAGDEGREGVEAFHVLVHTGGLDLLQGLDDRCKSWVVGGGDLEKHPQHGKPVLLVDGLLQAVVLALEVDQMQLHGVSDAVDGVLGSHAGVPSPVEVELGEHVFPGKSPSVDAGGDRRVDLHLRRVAVVLDPHPPRLEVVVLEDHGRPVLPVDGGGFDVDGGLDAAVAEGGHVAPAGGTVVHAAIYDLGATAVAPGRPFAAGLGNFNVGC